MSKPAPALEYKYRSDRLPATHGYLWEPILRICSQTGAKTVLDLGCGNGALCGKLRESGIAADGCDTSESGVAQARESVPAGNFHVLGVYDDPAALGKNDYDAVISTEVVEHLFGPRNLPRFAARVLRPGGRLIVTTPYHGYLKNVLIAAAGKWDRHHSALRDGGHIKFWSRATLTELLETEGFRVSQFIGAGRIPYLWKSMILVAEKRA